jgi:signal transduction histidine kinase
MNDNTLDDILIRPPLISARVRFGATLAFLAVSAMAFLVAGSLLIGHARSDRDQMAQRAIFQASSLSYKFDQEIASVKFLLKGLSKSPALLSNDLSGLYDQMKATEIPKGTWLLYQDLEKQVLNTSRAFGAELPRHSYFADHRERLERIRARGWTVSGRIIGPATGASLVALNLRLDGADGQMSHFLTTILSEERLRAVLDGQAVPADWAKGLYDRDMQPIVAAAAERSGAPIRAPPGLADRILAQPPHTAFEGQYRDVNAAGAPVLVAYRHSDTTNWTAVIEVPIASLDAPFDAASWKMGWLAVFFLAIGGSAVVFMTRSVEQPLEALSRVITSSSEQISDLSSQLLALQEDERRRIARELHDSTAQLLVAANLGISHINSNRHSIPDLGTILRNVETLIDRSLKELRIFTYLLHPPDLERDGLQATLRDFVEGFAIRSALTARIRIPEEIDAVAYDIQWTILRVVQEALGNVHRHADARRIVVNARVGATRLVIQIRDDGHGFQAAAEGGRIRFGVGILGMRARLQQFGGDLRIKSGAAGTTVIAIVPLTRMGRASLQAERLAELWPRRAGTAAHRQVL